MRDHFYTNHIGPIVNNTTDDIIKYLFSKSVLKEDLPCKSCAQPMSVKKYTRNKDGFAFRCLQTTCSNYRKYFSIRIGSIFEKYRFHLSVGIKLLWKWTLDETYADIMTEVDVHHQVLIDFYDDLRTYCSRYFLENPIYLGGGGIACQIDESLFRHKPKYHRGRATDYEIWVFGIADTSCNPSKIYMQIVDDRSASTLLPIITRVCRKGTIIVSDQWKAYNNIKKIGYEHLTVNHSLHFVDPQTQANTQAIESYWAKVKYRIKIKKGVYGDKLELYLQEWMWKDNIFNDKWDNLMDLLKIYG